MGRALLMLSIMKLFTSLLLMLFFVLPTNGVWQAPYFMDAQTDGVTFYADASGIQNISVREELSLPFKLAKINYDGVDAPTLGAFDVGNNNLLGIRVMREQNQWFLFVEKRQDYENVQQRRYVFHIHVRESPSSVIQHGILLILDNIFDNNPTVTYTPTPCKVEELHEDYLTNCEFLVYDPDGMEYNNIHITTTNENFEFVQFGEVTANEQTFKLRIKNALHYEEISVHKLLIKVFDVANNTAELLAILEVIDLPNLDPIWLRPLLTATFDEKQEQFFSLKAIDGDTGINKPICYRLEFDGAEVYSDLMSINRTSGLLHILPIDRDDFNKQIFAFYTCAFKCDNTSWVIKNQTVLIVHDINDHIPEITLKPKSVHILESKYLTLQLEQFFAVDKDLGINATYNAYLKGLAMTTADFSMAFTIVPNTGYQRTNFSLTITNADLLDYENETWRNFELMISMQELENESHKSNETLQIQLINWNDESPIFEKESYEVSVLENITSGVILQQVRATDRDIDDNVLHSIVGQIPGCEINVTTGVITLTTDNVFDFERQTLVILQIQARDSLITRDSNVLHTTYAQLTIRVLDVNDETPELRMPRSIVNITENAAPMSMLTDMIEAYDPDTTANLTISILWEASHATKGGRLVPTEDFIGCFVLKTQNPTNNLLNGILQVSADFNEDIDYEKYDTIYLIIRARDQNQEINDDSATAILTVLIVDVNDNPPTFGVNTLNEFRKVTELEKLNTVIGSIDAFDIDGPGNNVIEYSMRPIGNLTRDGLININQSTGVMRVGDYIQCDIPKIYNLEYEIVLTDKTHITIGKINVSIVDINNRLPELDDFEQQISIFENASTGHFVGQLKAHDDDRDAPHNILEYAINSAIPEVQNLFQIDPTNGIVTVQMRNDFKLDRDSGVPFHYIVVDIRDNFVMNNSNYGPINQKSTFINVTLLDINDNAPLMPPATMFSPEFSETDLKDTYSKVTLIAVDRDEPNTANSWVAYRISKIRPVQSNAIHVKNYDDIFDILGDNKTYGRLVTRKDLKGYYGLWRIEIEAYDHGEPVQRNKSSYDVYVRPYNFHAPRILFPASSKPIRVCYALQEPNRPLYHADCATRLPLFQAYDPDGAEYGDITFQLSSETGVERFFKIIKENRQQSSFYLQQLVPAGIYFLNVRAVDGGGSSSEEVHNLKVVFVDMLGNPLFLNNTFHTNFTENELGLMEERFIPEAYDPKNEGLNIKEERFKLYYFIDYTVYPDDAKYFTLHKERRSLKLVEMLDREAVDVHRVRIRVTNDKNGTISNPNAQNFTLDVIVQVNDVNDNPPVFTQSLYAGGIAMQDVIGKEILTVRAEDLDLDDPATYRLDLNSITAYGESLEGHKLNLFSLNDTNGVLSLDTYVTNSMKGYYVLQVIAEDTAHPPHEDVATIKIYIVSEGNRVKFVFLSDVQAIRRSEIFIREVFQEIYGYEICNIDFIEDVTNQQRMRHRKIRDVAPIGSDDGSSGGIAFISNVIVHFIKNNDPVPAENIQRRSADLAFVSKLQNLLQRRGLILNDVPHLSSEDSVPLVDNWTITALIVTCALLGATTVGLVVVFMMKLRALKRQLKAFDPPEFGSIQSNLNRINMPTTNIFSVEGSNPVINNESRQTQPRGVYDVCSSSTSEEDDEFDDLHDDPLFEVNNLKSCEQSLQTSFEHKILNSELGTKEKTDVSAQENERY